MRGEFAEIIRLLMEDVADLRDDDGEEEVLATTTGH